MITGSQLKHEGKGLLFFWLLLMSPLLYADDIHAEKILVKNIILMEPDDDIASRLVSIIIIDKKLDLVTEDNVDEEGMSDVINANQGILLGNLKIGEPASFMILDQDPREDFNVILDTKTHAKFAISKGVVVKNTLIKTVEVKPKEKTPKKSGWIAYQAPPRALPLSYKRDKDRWNTWDNDYFNGIFLAGLVIDRQEWLSQNNASEHQVGDLGAFDGGEIRGFRFGAVGQIKFKTPWVYTIFAASNAYDKGFHEEDLDEISFFDYRLDIPLSQKYTLSVGKQKEPISMERQMTLLDSPIQERGAASDALLPARNVGIVLSGYGFDQRATWAGGVFNDWFDVNQDFNESSSQLVGRATWLPYISENESALIHLGFGGRYSDAKEGVQFLTEPEFNQSPLFVDTGFHQADHTMTYNLEASLRSGPFWFASEYTQTDVASSVLNDPTLDGYHLTLSWLMTGGVRSYNRRNGTLGRVPIIRTVEQGGWGTWETAIRWSELDLNDRALEGGDLDVLSLGLNWYLNPVMTANINYRYITLDKADEFGNSLHGTSSGINTRIVLLLN